MILTVTPNANLDKTLRIEEFALNKVHRPSQGFTGAGGKGINVARVFQTLGGSALATGFLGGMPGRIVRKALRQEAIADDFVTVRGDTRFCIAIVDPICGTQTEINERGPEISGHNLLVLQRKIEKLLSQQTFQCVILNGSLPPGVPDTFYPGLIEIANKCGVPVVLDSSGSAVRVGVQAIPWMIKPNSIELEAILDRPIRDDADIRHAMEALHSSGIAIVAVTRGAEGAYLKTAHGFWEATPPKIKFASAVASGDSFLAAFLYQWLHGDLTEDAEQSLRLAVGAGAANAAVIGAGFCTKESIYAHAEQVVIHKGL